jgi:hypothetical protein
MSRHILRNRLAKAGDSRRLTDGEADALLACTKSVETPVFWTPHDRRRLRMSVPVTNTLSERLTLTGSVSRDLPGMSSWTLTWGNKVAGDFTEAIRRLDLRGKHLGNADGAVWNYETHKHRWTQTDGDREAYTPDDIPHEHPGTPQTRDDYRAIFEAFSAECAIDLGAGYQWSDPALDSEDKMTDGLWEV